MLEKPHPSEPAIAAAKALGLKELYPIGWFNCMPGMHSGGLVEVWDTSSNEPIFEDDWHELYLKFKDGSPEKDKMLLLVVEKHAWVIGRFGLSSLAERVWSDLTRSARGNYLAGISNHTRKGDKSFIAKLADADYSPEALCEIAANFLAKDQWPSAARLLDRHPDLTGNIKRFIAFRGKILNQPWKKEMDGLSKRVVDILLEAAIRLENKQAVKYLLKRGASPDSGIWQIFSSANHRYCALSFAIKNNFIEVATLLLNAGADPNGTEYADRGQPLLHALFRGHWELADLLIERGARFDGPKSHDFRPYHANMEMVEWIKQIAGSDFPLEPISTKPQFYTPYGMYGGRYTFLTAMLETKCEPYRLRDYILKGLDARPTAEELSVGIDTGNVTNLALILEMTGTPEAIRSHILNKAMTRADENARKIASE